MTEYEVLKFNHANKDVEVAIVRGNISGWDYSKLSKCTYIYCAGLTIFPVKESPEEVEQIYKQRSTK